MAKKQTEEKKIVRKITKSLPVKLTDTEILQYGKDLARAYAEKARVEAELDAIKDDYKGKTSEQAAQIGKLSGRVHSGIETREVECEEVKNWNSMTVVTTRLDTFETIESRPMREDEKQMEIVTTEG